MGLSPFAGLLPIGGWTRGSRIRFSTDSRVPLAAPACGARPSGTRQPPESLRIPLLNGRRAVRSRAFRCGRRRSLTRAIATFRVSEHLCSSGPTCLLIDRVRAPIFFVGVIASPVGETRDRSERRPIRTLVESIRLLGFVPAVGPCRRVPVRSAPGELDDRSCLGLCLFQGCRPRPEFVRLCVHACGFDPASRHQPPARGSPARLSARGRYGVSSRLKGSRASCRRNAFRLPGLLRSSRQKRLPFSVLWG